MSDFHPPALDAALRTFQQMIEEFFGRRLVSVILYGSIVFDDLAPGYGDLDFLAVIDGDLSEDQQRRLAELRKPLRAQEADIFAKMIEGAFLPRHMLDPARGGAAFWWGTSGERPWTTNELGWIVLHVIRECGQVIYGQDIRKEIPPVSRRAILEEFQQFPPSASEHAGEGTLHSVDWLLTAARLILWVREGRLSSKSEAADWGQLHAKGSWRELLPKAKYLRLNPAEADEPQWRQWLGELEAPIKAAAEELAMELRAAMAGPSTQ